MSPAFEFEHVTTGYNRSVVLRDIHCAVGEGEIVALLGPNGAGKSTLLRALTGLLAPFAGEIRLFGRDVRHLSALERSRLIAVVPQELKTPMAYSVEDLVFMGRAGRLSAWQAPTAADRQIVERALDYTDVRELRHRPLANLSGGEKQRAVIAMALAQEPRVMVMDEPTTHLDLNHALEVMEIIERLNREEGVTVLMTSHDLNQAAEFCRRLLLLDHGALVADGTPEEVLREDILRNVYHCDIRVGHEPATGAVLVRPLRRPRADQRSASGKAKLLSQLPGVRPDSAADGSARRAPASD